MKQLNMNFEKLNNYLDSLHSSLNIPVYGCSIHVNGEEVFRAGNDLSTGKDFFHFYSITKPLTSFCAMQLIEKGQLGLFDPVADYLPAFKTLTYCNGSKTVELRYPLRIHHLLSMSGGFDYNDDFDQMHALLDKKDQVRCEEAISLLAERPLHFQPGEHYMYSLGLDILGAIIEKISNLTLDAYMEQYIFRSIGSRDLTFYPTVEQYERMSPQLYSIKSGPEKENYFLHARHFPSGGCGLCGTVNDYMRFLDMLANDGVTISGERLLGSEAMNLFRTPMLSQNAQLELLNVRIEPELQALGIRVRPVPPMQGMYTGDGAAGAYCFASKESHVTLFFASHLLNTPDFYTIVHPTIFRYACEALGGIIADNYTLPAKDK